MRNITLVLVVLILTTVASQTFQYSRGWTNGKRDHKTDQAHDQSLTPCQIEKLKFLLLRKRFSERLLIPCDYDEDTDQRRSSYETDLQNSLTNLH